MSWNLDTAHSEIAFSIRHMMFAKVRGTFGKWSATVLPSDTAAFAGVSVEVDVASIDTREAQRDGHLRSGDFFDVANFPTATFVATEVRGDLDGTFELGGTLTLRGVTHPVTLAVTHTGTGRDPWGNTRRGYRATATLDRRAYGLTWNAALELGGVLVGETVDLEIEVQLVAGA